MTETNVLEVTLVDDSNYEKTLRLDNPITNINLAQIRAAFATPINEQWLLGRSGSPIVLIARANRVITQKSAVE